MPRGGRKNGRKNKLKTSTFDNKDFLESIFIGQKAVKDREIALEIITYTICRVKTALRAKPTWEEELIEKSRTNGRLK